MTPQPWRRAVVGLAASVCVSCGGEPGRWPGHDEPPALVVVVGVDQARDVRLDSVRMVPAPPVTFGATLGPDFNRGGAVAVPRSGRVRMVRDRGIVGAGDTLAVVVAMPENGSTPPFPVPSDRPGRWWPMVVRDSLVLAGDAIGLVQPRDVALAVGSVTESDARFLHRGDSAVVEFPRFGGVRAGARVEQVRFREPGLGMTAKVAIEVRYELPETGGEVRVTVIPGGPADSVWAIPAAALAHGSFGEAVFSPATPGSYRVTWIGANRRRTGEVMLVSEDLGRLAQVVTHGLPMLVEAVEDSLRARRAAAF
jgi:hypothetical protein